MKELFYKPLKIKHPDTDIFISSDLHLHQTCERWSNPLWKMRGYNSVAEHYEGMIQNWNSVVTNTSVCFLLGDSVFGVNGEANLKELFYRLNFHHLYLMPGNHYSGWRQIYESLPDNILQIGSKTVVFCPNYLEAIINGKSVVMSHYPLVSFNGQGGGSYHAYGHCHQNLKKSEAGPLMDKLRAIDVGVDGFPVPLSFKQFREILDQRPLKTYDHHDSETANPF